MPTFTGYPEEYLREFFNGIEGIAVLKNLLSERKITIYKAQLREPVRGIFHRVEQDPHSDLGAGI